MTALEGRSCLQTRFFSRASITCERASIASSTKVDKGQVAPPLLLYPTLRKKITQVDKLSLERRKEARNDKIVFFPSDSLRSQLLYSDNYFGQVVLSGKKK